MHSYPYVMANGQGHPELKDIIRRGECHSCFPKIKDIISRGETSKMFSYSKKIYKEFERYQ